jgi:hypothetical protein
LCFNRLETVLPKIVSVVTTDFIICLKKPLAK